ncbi:flagellar protein FlgN [Ornithinibacillus xuwenensis]|uniref:Flagellar protein FlgN n=1 Tax=Ornithinibacillus xuwenensis TaxID=3144668 RepID=A0ABU9XPG1_9BACI
MSLNVIIEKLEKLTSIHQQLLELSFEKTTVVKEGAVDKLQAILIKERKFVQQLEQAEDNRKKEVDAWFLEHNLKLDEATITNMINHLDASEKKELEESAVRLSEVILKLKQQEQLNMALIQQSMQFVQLSIDLMSPSLKNMNYGNKADKDQSTINRSVFDSKA